MKTKLLQFKQFFSKIQQGTWLVPLALLLFGSEGSVAQTTTTLTAVADAQISNRSSEIDENRGACNRFDIGRDNNSTYRALIRFDLSSLPANAIITSATLRLTRYDGDGAARDVSVHRVTNAWNEGTGDCGGNSNNNVTWNNRITSNAWSNAGGDFTGTGEDTTSVGDDGNYDWDITNLAEQWRKGTFSNHGLILKYVNETGNNLDDRFRSRETGDANERPRLIVTYITCPNNLGLTSTSAQNVTAGNGSVVTLSNTTASNLPVGSYTVTYNLGSPNAATGLTAAMTVSTAGTGTFTIPGAALTSSGTTSVTITRLKFSSCDSVVVSSGNTANIQVTCPGNISSVFVPDVFLGYNGNVTLSASATQLPVGNYFVTYNLGAPNTASGLVAGMTVGTAGTGVFQVPASNLSNPDSTLITIVDVNFGSCGKVTLSSGNTFKFKVIDFNPACGFGPGKGCSNTNYNNSFMQSTNDAATIEYNNFLSTYHSSIIRTPEGSFMVWGEDIASNGTSNVLSPQLLNASNYSALGSAEVLKVAGGSLGSSTGQWILLATDGLYAWGQEDRILDDPLTSSAALQKITGISGANTFGLPSGVNPTDVKMLVASASANGGTVMITTCDGFVYAISEFAAIRGNGGTGNATTWYQVTRDTSGNPALSGIIATRLSGDAAMALGADGSLWTWGIGTYLGNNTANATRNRATRMSRPTGSIKMIGTADHETRPQAYYVLMADGNLYTMGDNNRRQLGDWSTTERRTWVQPRYSSGGAVMSNIHWISPQETDGQYAAVNVINKDSTLWAFGSTENGMLGRGNGGGTIADPGIPSGITSADKITSVHTGGHTTMLTEKCRTFFGYVGHQVRGSMADGTTTDAYQNTYTFATAEVPICGTTAPEISITKETEIIGPTGKYCVGTKGRATVTPAGGVLSTSNSGIVSISGNSVSGYELSFLDTGKVTLTYLYTPSGCSNVTDTASAEVNVELCQLTLPDMNVTYVHLPVSGLLATNDQMPAGSNYYNPVLTSSPAGSIANIQLDTNGNYTFTGSKPGIYVYETEVCAPWTNTPCPKEILTITVLDANVFVNSPVANPDFAITPQGVPVSLQTLLNDAPSEEDIELVPSTVSIISGTAPNASTQGSLNINSTTGVITFTPVSSFLGSVTYSYRVCDDQVPSQCDTTQQIINVYPSLAQNQVLGIDDYAFTPPATPVSGNVVENDVDPENDLITVASQNDTLPGTGILVLNTNGSFTFTPERGFSGPVNYPYTLCDDGTPQACAQATLYILVAPENRIVPVVDYNSTFVNIDISGNVRTNDMDPEGDHTWVSQIGSTAVGSSPVTVSTAAGGSITIDSLGVYTYEPLTDFTGLDSIAYTLCDDGIPQACKEAVLYITVNGIPELWNPSYNNTEANPDKGMSYGQPITLNLKSNDRDLQKHQQVFSGVFNPNSNALLNNGTINNITGVDDKGNPVSNAGSLLVNTDGTVQFTPTAGFSGQIQTMNYATCDTVSSPNTACDTTTIEITVMPVIPGIDQAPFAGDDYAVTSFFNTPVNGNWLNNDSDPNIAALSDRIRVNGKSLIINPNVPGSGNPIDTLTTREGGTVVLKDDGTFTYTPALNYIGSDDVVYEICDTVAPVQCSKATIYLLSYGIRTDFGDLQSAASIGAQYVDFNTDGQPDGSGALWLGSAVTSEVNANNSFNASSDNGDDGLIIPAVLDSVNLNTYRAIVRSNSAGVTAYVQLQIDWNNDGVFDSLYNATLTTSTSGSDTTDLIVDLPTGLGAATINYRLLVSSEPADFSKSLMSNGEAEDYQVSHATPVPVTLIDFNAKWSGSTDAIVYWSTATEVNNQQFELFRSLDNVHYELIHTELSKAPSGNSNAVLKYAFIDENQALRTREHVFYKLVQKDFDGSSETFGPVVLSKQVDPIQISVFPNPVQNILRLEMHDLAPGNVEVSLISASGQVVYRNEYLQGPGTVRENIQVSDLESGMYYLQISMNESVMKVFKVLKVH